MAGNQNSGRHRLPISDHIDNGTYRPGKHGPIPDTAEGTPQRPRGLKGDARKLWERIVPDLVARGMAKAVDEPALESLCEMWGLYKASLKLAAKDPIDKAARCAVVGYLDKVNALGKRFGLAFGDRQKMRVGATDSTGPAKVASRQRA